MRKECTVCWNNTEVHHKIFFLSTGESQGDHENSQSLGHQHTKLPRATTTLEKGCCPAVEESHTYFRFLHNKTKFQLSQRPNSNITHLHMRALPLSVTHGIKISIQHYLKQSRMHPKYIELHYCQEKICSPTARRTHGI